MSRGAILGFWPDDPAGPSGPPKTPSATNSPPSNELADDDLSLVLVFTDALVTKTRLRNLQADAS
jgi:hypothetical protein